MGFKWVAGCSIAGESALADGRSGDQAIGRSIYVAK
jgi:hypothetical protein